MFLHNIGIAALNLSMLVYFFWFIPQLVLTFKCRTTASLSLGMHALLLMGYLADVVYAFGQHLPLQYQLVASSGLFSLAVMHFQFWRYSQWQANEKRNFCGLTLCFILLFFVALYHLTSSKHSEQFYNVIGALSWLCWLSFMWPQLLKNFTNQSTKGLSTPTVVLSLFSGLGDLISAFALAWAWPSKWGTLLSLLPKGLLLLQCYYYKNALARGSVNAA